jgi:hypothetical protein
MTLRNNKSSGEYNVSAELLKRGDKKIMGRKACINKNNTDIRKKGVLELICALHRNGEKVHPKIM